MKKQLFVMLVLVFLFQSIVGVGAWAEESTSTFAEHGLEESVHNLSDVAGKQKYDLPTTVNGGNYIFTVTPFWGKFDFPDDHPAKCYVPEGSEWQELPYVEHFKPVIDSIEKMVPDEEEHEWRCIALDMATNGAPGWSYSNALTDYYNSNFWDTSYKIADLEGGGKADVHKVTWNGLEQTVYGLSTYKTNPATYVITLIQMYYVPVGYDGVVLLLDGGDVEFLNPDTYAPGDDLFQHVTDNTLIFRVK